MRINPALICLITFSLLCACNHTFREFDKKSFPSKTWNDSQEISFRPVIHDNNKKYDLIMALRHHHALQVEKVGVKIKVISPSGKEAVNHFDLAIKDRNNKHTGKCAGDLCDLEVVFKKDFHFEETGEYQFVFRHNEQGHKIPGIMEVGLIIDESK